MRSHITVKSESIAFVRMLANTEELENKRSILRHGISLIAAMSYTPATI
jgi:hypothetical protein